MVWLNLLVFLLSLFLLVKAADHAVIYSSRISKAFHLSEFVVSFFIVAIISCTPEATVAIISAIQGVPEFGLGTLLGSNIADLSLVFGVVALASMSGIKVKSAILRHDLLYLLLLLVPILLGIDGHLSRIDGAILLLCGLVFYVTLSIESHLFKKQYVGTKKHSWVKNMLLLVLAIALLIASANFTVNFGMAFAADIGIPPFIIALTMVAIGTCLPELLFSLKAVRSNHEELALGDLLGTVITDATIIIGIIALINPFTFNAKLIHITGMMMFIAGALVITFIKSEKVLSKREGLYLLLFYLFSIIAEFVANHLINL